jgi:hypothetical protein
MPKRTDLESILIIGAGPIIIGQACEFDYSGAQACKALKQEGYRVILVNSNPATIMTDPETADATYIEPIRWQTLERIIAKEKPDAVLPTMGGQTALNCALDLAKHGVLDQYGVELIGANAEAIDPPTMVIGLGMTLRDEAVTERAGGMFAQPPVTLRRPQRGKFVAGKARAHADDRVLPRHSVAAHKPKESGRRQCQGRAVRLAREEQVRPRRRPMQ